MDKGDKNKIVDHYWTRTNQTMWRTSLTFLTENEVAGNKNSC